MRRYIPLLLIVTLQFYTSGQKIYPEDDKKVDIFLDTLQPIFFYRR